MDTVAAMGFADMWIAKVVGLRDEGDQADFYVVLEELDGDGALPMLIGQTEAMTLSASLGEVSLGRPQTATLAAALVRALRGQVDEVRIDRVDGPVYLATLEVSGPAGAELVDARPSDALNLAVLFGCPVRVSRLVLAEAAARRSGADQNAERLRRALELAPVRVQKAGASPGGAD